MNNFWPFLVVVFGGLIIQPLVKADDGAAAAGGTPGAAKNGTAEAIRENPENSKPYVNYGNKRFDGIQNALDQHFDNKKKEGDRIKTTGDQTRQEGQHTQGRMEKTQYDKMYETWKWAEGEMHGSVQQLDPTKEGNGTVTTTPATEAQATTKAPEEDVPAPPPAGGDDDDE